MRKVVLATALLAATVWLTPVIVAKTVLLEHILNRALADSSASIHVGSASLGWFSPLRMSGLEICDVSGKVVVDIETFLSEKSLLAIITRPSELGAFRVLAPTLTLEVDSNGTNLERILVPIVSDSDEFDEPSSTAGKRSAELIVGNGTIHIQDVERGRNWLIEELEASVRLGGGPNPRVQLALAGNLGDPEPGRFRLELDAPLTANPPTAEQVQSPIAQQSGKLRLEADRFPLALLGACLRRLAPDLDLEGGLSGQVACHWARTPGAAASAELGGDLTVENLLAGGSWLGADRLRLKQLHVACRAVRQGEQLRFESAEIACDLGRVAFRGAVPLDGDWQGALLRETYELTGDLDLARLAQTLPSTIRIRDDTQITAGRIQLSLSRTAEADFFGLRGRIDVDQLSAVHEGKPIHWAEPLRVELLARDGDQEFVIDRLHCASTFLQFNGSGTSDNFSARTWFDLDQLTARLAQFIDLGSLRLAGTGSGGLTIRKTAGEAVALDSRLDVERFLLTTQGRPPWQDDQLTAIVHLTARTDGKTWKSLDSAELELVGGPDRFTAQLRRSMPEPSAAGPWPVEIRLVGELARWRARLAPWFTALDEWRLRGHCDLAAAVDYSSEAIDVSGVRLRLQNFGVLGGGLFINEPSLEVRGNVHLNRVDLSLRARQLFLESQTLSATSDELVLDWSRSGLPSGEGSVVWQGDLSRLQSWLHDPQQPTGYNLYGRLQGELQLAAGDGLNSARLNAVVEQMAVAWAENRSWQEPRVRLVAHAIYDHERQSLALEQLELTSQGLACSARGRLTDLTSRRWLALDGELQYDLARLEPLLQAIAGDGIRVAGRGRQPFSIHGPLGESPAGQMSAEATKDDTEPPPTRALARLEARAALDWQSADVYGFRVGPGQLQAELARGTLSVDPLELLISEGRFQAAPLVRFEPRPAELQLGATKLFDNVRITPAISRQALKYVAPVLAGVSRAEGRFSIDVDGCRVPLASPKQGDFAGRLTIHAIEISPGPLVEQFAILFGRPGVVRLAEQSIVAFRMVEGRVYHQGLQLVWPNVTIRTYGSVGFDGTLALMAEMPVPEKWIGNNPVGDALRNRIIRLPIGGTLEEPRLDQQALQRVSSEILRDSGINSLRHELNRQLDRLLGPRR